MNLPVDNIMHDSFAPRVLSIVQYKQVHLNVCHAPTIIIPTGAEYINETKKRREKKKGKGKGSFRNTGLYMWEKRTRKK